MREYLETHYVKSILSNSLCYIASIILKNKFESTVTKKKYRINFPFYCNSCCVVYLLTC